MTVGPVAGRNAAQSPATGPTVDGARAVAETVTDPELPMLTLHDLGVLRDVHLQDDGTLVVDTERPDFQGGGAPVKAKMTYKKS